MTVEVGFSLAVPGATWGTLEFAYNRYDAIYSFLLSLLLAPPVVWVYCSCLDTGCMG